ncbi:MAG TPA: metalloregulator ArsR/SmtB family transcription factor [Trueperaceae bacterium]|nr:metalloregulator ArsR/SmtB family transcription factor [Trueperaceae bacterium]
MHPFAVLGDPVRRRLVEVLATREHSAGELVALIGQEFAIGQSAVSQQLRVLKDEGFATVRAEGRRRIYGIEPAPLESIGAWIAYYRSFWESALADLDDEIERGKRERAGSGRTPS